MNFGARRSGWLTPEADRLSTGKKTRTPCIKTNVSVNVFQSNQYYFMMLREVNSSLNLESTVVAVPTVCVNIKSSITLNT
jgi:hypothetical protein